MGPYGDFDETGQAQVELLAELLSNRTQLNLQGLAVSVVNATVIGSIIEEFMSLNIPVLTFDSDAVDSKRIAYVGTDNYFFGTQLAKVLKQVHPSPGRFAIVSATSPNIIEREQGVRDHLIREGWEEVSTSPSDMNSNSTLVVENMFDFAQNHPDLTAIIPVMGAGMRAPDNYWSKFVKAHPEILLVVGDAMPNQLELLDRQQCDGLVGQLPYEMGVLSMDTLFQIYTTNSMLSTDSFIGTNVLEHLLIPLVLPELKVDHNLVGELRYVGYCLFASVAAVAIGFSCWTFVNRNARVVKVAQPLFLMLVAAGTFLMAAAVLPLGFDDFTHDLNDLSHGIGICMAPFWFLAFGFSLTFSSLFAKIYRVNLLFEAAKRFARMEASIASILSPLILLSLANGIILTTWTIISPLKYVRVEHSGTDGWDRAISDFGTCQGENSKAFIIPLAFVNGIMLVFANWIAYKTRRLDEEFSESKYVGMVSAFIERAGRRTSGRQIYNLILFSPQNRPWHPCYKPY
jgi:ABC-type sugar transport system substrate-binding protein